MNYDSTSGKFTFVLAFIEQMLINPKLKGIQILPILPFLVPEIPSIVS